MKKWIFYINYFNSFEMCIHISFVFQKSRDEVAWELNSNPNYYGSINFILYINLGVMWERVDVGCGWG